MQSILLHIIDILAYHLIVIPLIVLLALSHCLLLLLALLLRPIWLLDILTSTSTWAAISILLAAILGIIVLLIGRCLHQVATIVFVLQWLILLLLMFFDIVLLMMIVLRSCWSIILLSRSSLIIFVLIVAINYFILSSVIIISFCIWRSIE